MNAPFLHRSLTEAKNPVFNGVLTSDIIYRDFGRFNSHSDIWTYPHETVFPMLYGEGYAIHEHLAPFGLVYLKELTGFFAEGPDIGTSGFYNNLSIDDDLGNVNSSIETGCNSHRQTDWVKDKPGQEAYFDKNVTSKDDPDLKGRIYLGKRFLGVREDGTELYSDERGNVSAYTKSIEIFGLSEINRLPTRKQSWDSNGDGQLQKDEADHHWQYGRGTDISVDNSKIDWTGLEIPSSAKVGEKFSINTTQAFLILPYETASTYGGTSFILRGPRSVEVVDQLYHYRYRPNNSAENLMRNFMTWYGKPEGIIGTDYMIHYINPLIIIK